MTVVEKLRSVLDSDCVISGPDLALRATSYWDSSPTHAVALVLPRSTSDVSNVLKVCHELSQPVVVQGGLTGCVEGAVATESEVILSLERLNKIEDIDEIGGTATVQAGVILEALQEAVSEKQLLFPLDLGARGSCTIGGNIATNAGGINVLRYGMMRELTLGLEAVLPDGSIVSSMNRMLKNNAGYDLKQMFIGSEGTLGVVTRAVVKLFPRHTTSNTALVGLDRFESVTQLLQEARSHLAGNLSAFEIMWGEYYRAVTEPGWHRPPLARDFPFYVVMESEGSDADRDDTSFASLLERMFEEGIVVDAVIPKSESERKEVWKVREDFEAILTSKPCFLYDVSLPIKHMPGYVDEVSAEVRRIWPNGRCFVLGHVADGNLHLFVTPGAEGAEHAECNTLVYPPLKNYGGSVSAEHGIGTEKMAWLYISRNYEEILLMQQLKGWLDPRGILNPSRVLSVAE